jgi:hypothetical protein
VIIHDRVDPAAHGIAPHYQGVVGFQQFGRRSDNLAFPAKKLMPTGGHQLEECGFPNFAEANGLRPISKLSRPRGDYERNGDFSPTVQTSSFDWRLSRDQQTLMR